MLSILSRRLSAPALTRGSDRSRLADRLSPVLTLVTAFWAVSLVGQAAGRRTSVSALVAGLALVVILAGLWACLHHRPASAAAIGAALLGAMAIGATATTALAGSVRSPAAGAFLLFVFLAASLYGRAGLAGSAVVGAPILLALTAAEAAGRLPAPSGPNPLTDAITVAAQFALAAALAGILFATGRSVRQRADSKRTARQSVAAGPSEPACRLRQVLDQCEDIVAAVDTHHQVLVGNSAHAQACAAACLTFTLQGPETITGPREALGSAWERAYDWALHGEPFRLTLNGGPKGSQERGYEFRVEPLLDAGGAVVGAWLLGRDVSARRAAAGQLGEAAKGQQIPFDDNPQPMLVFDPASLAVLDVNAAAIQLYQYPRSEFLGLNVSDLQAARVPAAGAPPAGPGQVVRHRRRDGAVIDVEAVTRPLPLADRPARLAVITDVTARHQAEQKARESEARLAQVLECLPETVFAVDSQAALLFASRHFQDDLAAAGLPALALGDSLLGLPFPPEVVAELRSAVAQAAAGTVCSRELDRGPRKLAHTFTPLRDASGTVIGALVAARPGAQSGRTEPEAGTSLEERVRHRAASLSRANAQFGLAARAKNEYLAALAHEMRTPLGSLMGLASTLRDGVFGQLTERQGQVLEALGESGRALLDLVDDLRDFTALESGRIELHPAPLVPEEVCQACLQAVRPAASAKRLRSTLSFSGLPHQVLADDVRLRQIVGRLLHNAVDFTPEGGQIGLDASWNREAGAVRFAFWDTGTGIPAEKHAHLLEPASPADGRLFRDYGPAALGLQLVRALVELHGGCLAVGPNSDHGNRYVVDLPLEELPAGSPEPPPVRLTSALIIDGDSGADLLGLTLRELGAQVKVEQDGRRAIECAAQLQPDVILLSAELPGRSGWEALAALKADERTRPIPVILLSDLDDFGQGPGLGAAGWLVKPISSRELRLAVLRVLGMPPSPPAARVEPATQQGPLILLAEPNPVRQRHLGKHLLCAGFRLVLAMDGEEALERAHARRPDLIVLNQRLPGLDGVEVVSRLRAQPEFAAVPVYMLTALLLPGDRERCLGAGANGHWADPAERPELLSALTAWAAGGSGQA